MSGAEATKEETTKKRGYSICCFNQPTSTQGEEERDLAWNKMWWALGKFCFVLVLGIEVCRGGTAKPEKWIPAVELHPGSPAFAALGLPPGHFGFIGTNYGLMPANNTDRLKNLVDCDADFCAGPFPDDAGWYDKNVGCHFQGPCYLGLHFLVRVIWFFTMVAPILPILVAMLEAFRTHPNDKGIMARLRGTCASHEGHRGQRCMVYVGSVLFLQVVVIVKRHIETAMGTIESFDPSDTIFVFLSVGAIATREVAHVELSKAPGATAVKYAVRAVLYVQMYYVFWTARYFHLPSEALSGAAMGIAFALLFHACTTTKGAFKGAFMAAACKHHDPDPVEESSKKVKAREPGAEFSEPLLSA